MALRFGNHRLPLLGGKFQNSPQALRLIQSGPPNIHQWAGIINQLRASNCGIQRRFRSRRGHRLPSCVFVASKDHHSAIFHPHKYISLLRITVILYCNISLLNLANLFQGKTTGQDLLDNIYKYLNLIETAYFGLRYQDNANQTVGCFLFYILYLVFLCFVYF